MDPCANLQAQAAATNVAPPTISVVCTSGLLVVVLSSCLRVFVSSMLRAASSPSNSISRAGVLAAEQTAHPHERSAQAALRTSTTVARATPFFSRESGDEA